MYEYISTLDFSKQIKSKVEEYLPTVLPDMIKAEVDAQTASMQQEIDNLKQEIEDLKKLLVNENNV